MLPGISRGIRLRHPVQNSSSQTAKSSANINVYELPLVGRVAAGSPILAQEHIESKYQLDPSLFSEKPDYLLRVRGLSMRDIGILEDDLIAVKKTSQVYNGQVVVARIDDDVTVKRFMRKGARVELISENPDFQPIIIQDDSHQFVIEGRVVGLVRNGF